MTLANASISMDFFRMMSTSFLASVTALLLRANSKHSDLFWFERRNNLLLFSVSYKIILKPMNNTKI